VKNIFDLPDLDLKKNYRDGNTMNRGGWVGGYTENAVQQVGKSQKTVGKAGLPRKECPITVTVGSVAESIETLPGELISGEIWGDHKKAG